MEHTVEQRILALAQRQLGVVSRQQLLSLGLGPGVVRRRVASGAYRRLHRGVYLLGPIEHTYSREMAAVLACGPGAVTSHRSGAWLWDLIPSPATGSAVDISVAGRHNTDRPGIRVRRRRHLHPSERTVRHGVPVTAPGRTLLDLATVAGPDELERAVARAERERLIGPRELSRLIARHPGREGIPALRAIVERAGGPALTRSEAEARFLALVRRARLAAPEANVRIAGREVDFFWRAERVAVEVDGYRYHGSRARFESDHRRATHLAAHGVHVIPVTWRQVVDDEVGTAADLARALAHAQLARGPGG
jgi:very-short-patch-repair endonuclease